MSTVRPSCQQSFDHYLPGRSDMPRRGAAAVSDDIEQPLLSEGMEVIAWTCRQAASIGLA